MIRLGADSWQLIYTRECQTLFLFRASFLTSQLRAIKSLDELDRLQQASSAVDKIAHRLQTGNIDLVGRTEKEVSEELGRQIIEEGHEKVNFAIVAAGENAASPHHEAGSRIIRDSEIVLCDFGGTMYETTELVIAPTSHDAYGQELHPKNL